MRLRSIAMCLLVVCGMGTVAYGAAGDLVVYRVGSGTGSLLNTGNPVFLDFYSPTGTLNQSIALPTSVNGTNRPLVASGTATSEGLISLSADGKYILLTGYDSSLPATGSLSGLAVNRVIGRVDSNGTIDTSTSLSDYAVANNPRSAASTNGTDIWVTGGNGGVRYTTLGSSTSSSISTTVTNLRQINIFNNQLYISDSSGSAVRIGTVGTGTPTTTGQTIVNLPGFLTSGSPYAFFLADLDAGVAGPDTLYVADDTTSGGQIQKFSLVAGAWTANGTITASSIRGLTGSVSGSTVTLYGATGGSAASGGGSLYKFTDSTGYNGTVSGAVTIIASAATNTAFRGVAFAPSAPIPTVNLSVSSNTGTEAAQTAITVTATASSAVSGDQTVTLTVSGTNITTGDYTLNGSNVASIPITIPNGSTTGTVTFTVVDDALVEGTETAVLTISAPTSGIALGSTTTQSITITDNDTTPGLMRITEFMYNDNGTGEGEFVEFTNVGGSTVDMTGWSFDDNSRTAGSFSLSAFGVVQPGESVILAEKTAAAFRLAWSLPNSVKVIGGNNQNLGSSDEINLYDNTNTLVDRLTYASSGNIITNGTSGWTGNANLGANTIGTWQLSVVGDAKISYLSAGGNIGNPGGYVINPGVTIRESGGSTNVTEGGATDTYTVVLNTQPASDVTITINSDTQVTTNPTSLIFTTANWNAAQTVTVTAVDDTFIEGNHTGTITHTTNSADLTYNNISVATVVANITDNDSGGGVAPTIVINTTTTTNFLDGGAVASPASPFAISGVISDPTDPAKNFGIDFTLADSDTPVANLTVTAVSSNTMVVPLANLNLTGTGGSRNLKIIPAAVGYSDITVTVSDPQLNSASFVLNYAASAASSQPATTRFLTGASNASTAIALDADYMLVGDDENQALRLYDRNNSGLPVTSFDFTSSLGLTDLSGGIPREVDIEASTRVGNRIYWMGSQSNTDPDGANRPNRDRVFGTDISGSGAATTLSYAGRYDFLREDIIAWDHTNAHGKGVDYYGLAASGAVNVSSKVNFGYNVEGLEMAPDNSTAYVAFRAPQVLPAARNKALIVTVTNFTTLLNISGGGTLGMATFGAPIEMDLGGRGIREIRKNSSNDYVIIAGSAGDTGPAPNDFQLYTWTGIAADLPVLRTANLAALNADGSFESVVEVPHPLANNTQLQLLVDNGSSIFYNDGLDAKSVAPNFQKSRSELVTLGNPFHRIHDIQGSGATAAITGIQTIEAIVTAKFTGLTGFYVQEADADADNDPATSEALFVFDPTALFTGSVGDRVRVTGTISEFTTTSTANGGNTSSLTEMGSLTNVTVVSSGNPLPTAVNVTLPVASYSDLERYEGMRVNVSAATDQLTVSENYQLGRFGQVVLAADGPGSNNQAGTDARFDQYTQFFAPSESGYAAYLAANAKRRIYLDDANSAQNADPILFGRSGNPLSDTNTLRSGDTVATVSGILDERFEGYRVQTTTGVNFSPTNARPVAAPSVGGTLKVACFNVLNYFNDLDLGSNVNTNGLSFEPRGANTAIELTRQRDKIINAIVTSGADVMGLMEIENNGFGPNGAIQDLVNGLNALAGAGTYTFVTPPVRLGTDAINVGLIYKPSKVAPVGAAAAIPDAYGTGAFDIVGRKPLAQTFQQISNGQSFTIVVNHFKSKGTGTAGVGDVDIHDGQGAFNGTRTRQANDLVAWLATKPTGTNNPDYLLVGDFNSYAKEDPLAVLETAGYQNLLLNTAYSYVFDAQVGALDHALATSSLAAKVTGADKWHINCDEPTVLDYNTEFKSAGQINSLYSSAPYRASDHDPVFVGLNIGINPTLGTLNTTAGTINTAYSGTVAIINGTTPFSSLTQSGLPAGLTAALSGNTITISGTPTATGTFNALTLGVTDASGTTVSNIYTLTINTAITVTPATLPSGTVLSPYSQTVSSTGGTGTKTFSISVGALPPNLVLNTTTGLISGTPGSTGAFNFTIVATDAVNATGSTGYTVIIAAPPITLAPATLPAGISGVPYSQQLTASGAITPYTFAVASGALPTGITLTNGGLLSGTPTAGGAFNVTIKATDSSSGTGPYSGTTAYTLTIGAPAIIVSVGTLPNAKMDFAYPGATITAAGGVGPYRFAVTAGSLPAGLTLSPTGAISGTPTAEADSAFTITATDSSTGSGPFKGSGAATIVFDRKPVFLSGPNVDAAASVAELEGTFTATTDTSGATITWNFGDGSPTVTGATVQHIYAVAGTYTVTVTAVNPATSTSATKTLTVVVTDDTHLGGTVGMTVTHGVIKLGGKLDSITFKGSLPLKAVTDITKLPLTVTIGGVAQTFQFNKTGAAKSGSSKAKLTFKHQGSVIPDQTAKLTCTLSGTGFKNLLSRDVQVDSNGLPVKIVVEFNFNAQTFSYVDHIIFKKSGKTTTGKFGQ